MPHDLHPIPGPPPSGPGLLTRRRALQALGVLGAATLLGCTDDDGTAGGTSTTANSGASTTGVTGGSADCDAIPEETGGPYPGDGSQGDDAPDVLAQEGIVRSDITASFGRSTTVAQGVPLTIELDLVDTATSCAALAGAAVYVWHCDREGRYSMYSPGVEDENYLRGVQAADGEGRATFQSVFPATYPGRWPHLHFAVYESVDAATGGGTRYTTSQVALPRDACEAVYATSGYEDSVDELEEVSLSGDGVFGDDDGERQLGVVTGSADRGYRVRLTVPVDPSGSSSGGSGGGPGGGGSMGGGPMGGSGGPGGPPPGSP